jgi:rhodanese-related sulfurtransferase/DNA-binding transcriptional ArsR family regulator
MSFKKSLFDQFARVTKALGSANRLEILEFLAQCEYSVEDLSRLCKLTVANTSQHLQRLRQAGLVTSRKSGLHVYYALNGGVVFKLLQSLREVADHNLEEIDTLVSSYLAKKDSLEPISREDLLRAVQQGGVTVLDLRPAAEYAAGHLPTAVNVALESLPQLLKSIAPHQTIVAYCRGPYCVLSYDAVEFLRNQGRKAIRLEEGFPEWKNAGLPTEIG